MVKSFWEHVTQSGDGFGISPQTAAVLWDHCKVRVPKAVVDLGTGSGMALGVMMATLPSTSRVWTVDNAAKFFPKARDLLLRYELRIAGVTYVHAPLVRRRWNGEASQWYEVQALAHIPEGIDLLFVDGPEGSYGRYPALPVFLPRLSRNATVMLDDAHRPRETGILQKWLKFLKAAGYRYDFELKPTDRGLGVIRLR